jgi:serine/threonine-protein phosphatase 2A regulatory subunit B
VFYRVVQSKSLTELLITTEFEEEEDPSNRSFFSEIISSISDVKFSQDGRYMLSRDYLSLKIWDINMDSRPIRTIQIHDHLRGKLCDLYENDCIFDKFECTFSGDGKYASFSPKLSRLLLYM